MDTRDKFWRHFSNYCRINRRKSQGFFLFLLTVVPWSRSCRAGIVAGEWFENEFPYVTKIITSRNSYLLSSETAREVRWACLIARSKLTPTQNHWNFINSLKFLFNMDSSANLDISVRIQTLLTKVFNRKKVYRTATKGSGTIRPVLRGSCKPVTKFKRTSYRIGFGKIWMGLTKGTSRIRNIT